MKSKHWNEMMSEGPYLLQAIRDGSVLEGGRFAFLNLQLEAGGDEVVDFSFAADVESMAALGVVVSQLIAMQRAQLAGSAHPPTTLGFRDIKVEPGRRLDQSDGVVLRMILTSGLELVFGLERPL